MARFTIGALLGAGLGSLFTHNFNDIRDVLSKKPVLAASSYSEKGDTLVALQPNIDVFAKPEKLEVGDTITPSSPSSAPSRVSEIMRFGYPGFEMLRTFEDFVLSYDRRNRVPNWVIEHLTPERLVYAPDVDRKKSDFSPDRSLHSFFRSTNEDYFKSGFDRGHMAAAANHRKSQNAINQTFLLTNMAPQVGVGFNRGKWNDLEKHVRNVARKNRNVYVCTGPLYLPKRENDGKLYVKYEVIGKNNVAVPTHFFKVLLVESQDGKVSLDSYVMPNAPIDDGVSLKAFRVPIDSIERSAGFLIFERASRSSMQFLQ